MPKRKEQPSTKSYISDIELKSLARVLFPIMQEYLSSEQGQKDYAEWQQSKLNKQSKIEVSR